MKSTPRKTSRAKQEPLFVRRAKRAMLHAGENVRKENRAFNLPLIVWEDGKMVKKPD